MIKIFCKLNLNYASLLWIFPTQVQIHHMNFNRKISCSFLWCIPKTNSMNITSTFYIQTYLMCIWHLYEINSPLGILLRHSFVWIYSSFYFLKYLDLVLFLYYKISSFFLQYVHCRKILMKLIVSLRYNTKKMLHRQMCNIKLLHNAMFWL